MAEENEVAAQWERKTPRVRAWGGGGDTPARSASRGQRSLWPDPQLLGTSPNEASIPAPVSPLANVSSGKGERWVQAKG